MMSTLTVIVSAAFSVSYAASNDPISHINKKEMQLAMIDYSHLLKKKKSTTVALARKKQKTPVEVFPSNCMTWNVGQINRKATSFNATISKYARQYKIDSNLIKSIITAESCFRTRALSKADARGLMQLIPATAKRFGVKDSYDPKQNIRGGVKYLRFLFDRFNSDLKKVIAAYNAGEGAVERYKGIPPYKETIQYVKNVLLTYDKLRAPLLANAKLKNSRRVKHVYQPPRLGLKPGRGGWQYNRLRAPHLYKR